MVQEQGITKGNTIQKTGSAGFIIGAILIVVGNIWVTMTGLDNPLGALQKYSENVHLLYIFPLLMTFGYWAVMIGTACLYSSIDANGSAWARLGFYFMIVGTTLWTFGMSLDTTYANVIANWLAAPDASKEFARELVTIYSGTIGIGRGNFPMVIMSNWLAFAFLGIGMVRSSIYPRSLGWVGIILGFIGLPMGAIMVFTGREAVWTFFMVLSFLTILWFFAVGIWVARKVW